MSSGVNEFWHINRSSAGMPYSVNVGRRPETIVKLLTKNFLKIKDRGAKTSLLTS